MNWGCSSPVRWRDISISEGVDGQDRYTKVPPMALGWANNYTTSKCPIWLPNNSKEKQHRPQLRPITVDSAPSSSQIQRRVLLKTDPEELEKGLAVNIWGFTGQKENCLCRYLLTKRDKIITNFKIILCFSDNKNNKKEKQLLELSRTRECKTIGSKAGPVCRK